MDTNRHKTPPKKKKKMFSTSERSCEEMFLCSICLEVFSEPVNTPCGHNFCKHCICEAWAPEGPCICPLCNRRYDRRPEISVNYLLLEMVSQFKQEKEKSKSQLSKPGEVSCDVCSEPKLKALKSCLGCLSSFCETHLKPHLTVSGLHQLMEPVENLEDRMCPKHQRLLEFFCGTDQSCVCTFCVLEHKNHEFVSLEEARKHRSPSLLQTQAQSQHMVEQRRLKVQEIQRYVELSDTEVHRERAAGLQAFTALMQSVQRRQDRFLEELQEKQSRSHKRAQELVQQLEKEICELEKSNTEVERLSRSQDSLHFLQRCPTLMPPAGLKEWSSVRFEPETYKGSVARALSELEKHLSEDFKQLFKQLPSRLEFLPSRLELLRVQQFVVDVTLDPDTAHPRLVLSEDLKQVHDTDVMKLLPDSPLRFDTCVCILGKQCFSSGRFYFEVQVKGKTNWVLGVVQESINRKGKLMPKNGFWCIVLRNKDQYKACTDPLVHLSLQRPPQKVGVFVDYVEGLVSFYDVDSADLLFSFCGCCFGEKLLPLLSPCVNAKGSNSAPLVLTAVETFKGESD